VLDVVAAVNDILIREPKMEKKNKKNKKRAMYKLQVF
jgi:hypothetical protein